MSETGDIDSLAAEYVLGTLDAGERAQAQALLKVDQALAAKVRIWERRLSELHLMVEPIEPEGEIWDRIRRHVPKPPPPPVPPPPAPPEPEAAPPVAVPVAAAEPPAPIFKPFTVPAFAPPTSLDQPLTKIERPSLESLEEAVLKAADALQQRAVAEAKPEPVEIAEPQPEPEPEPQPELEAEPERVEADEKPTETSIREVQETLEEAAERATETAGQAPETAETAAVAAIPSRAVADEPPPSVPADIREPTPKGPLAAFPTPFSTSAPLPSTAPLIPSPAPTLSVPVPPPAAPPSPALAVRPSERRQTPPARVKSHWLARFIAPLVTLILLALAALVAAWRFAPERVPQPLRPVELLRSIGIATPTTVVGPPPRKPAPPESRYDE